MFCFYFVVIICYVFIAAVVVVADEVWGKFMNLSKLFIKWKLLYLITKIKNKLWKKYMK